MSELTLVIGNKNYSSWSLRPWLFLKYHEIPFSEIKVSLYTDGYKEKIMRYSAAGKVPSLMDGDLTVWDSLSILEYLADKFPEKKGWPDTIKARAKARSISAEMHSGFFNLRSEMPMNCRKVFGNFKPSEKAIQDIKRVRNIWSDCLNTYAADGPWLFGRFSIADCMYAPVVTRFVTYGTSLSEQESQYVKTVKTHPAMVSWISAAKEESEIIASSEIDGY
ncbi:glutathione S-transferase family protein [bacterium]|nr:glutathione S-transferase family protein [bacterium]